MPPALLGGLSTLSCAQEVLRKRLPIICWSLIASLQYPIIVSLALGAVWACDGSWAKGVLINAHCSKAL